MYEFYGHHFEADDYVVFKLCHYVKSGILHLHSEFYDDMYFTLVIIVKSHTDS